MTPDDQEAHAVDQRRLPHRRPRAEELPAQPVAQEHHARRSTKSSPESQRPSLATSLRISP
jgi:hypothetical protein